MRLYPDFQRWIAAGFCLVLLSGCGGKKKTPDEASPRRPAATVEPVSADLTGSTTNAASGEEEDLPLEHVRLPLENYENGQIKTQVEAQKARIPAAGDIVAVGMVITMYLPDGSIDGQIHADRCRLNRMKGEAWSDSPVRLEKDGIVITGVGFDWKNKNQTITIHDKAKVVFRRSEIKALHKSKTRR